LTAVNDESALLCIKAGEHGFNLKRRTMKASPLADSRRHFFRTIGCTVAAAAVTVAAAPMREARAYDPGREETRARYRETDDVKAFYRTNRYERVKR
jgi:hypothetical protein